MHLPVVFAVAFAFAESTKSPPILAGVRSLRILNADDVGVVDHLEGGDLILVPDSGTYWLAASRRRLSFVPPRTIASR